MVRIALVDDSRLVRVAASAALRAKGYEVVEVEPTSMFDVLKALHETPMDLVLVDLLMPACSGEHLVRACREDALLADLPILIVSAHRDEASLANLQQLGISGFLLKPMDPAVLAARVAEALAC